MIKMMMMMIIIIIIIKKQGARKEIKTQKNKYRNSSNVEHEMFCHTSNHWSHRNFTKGLKKYLETIPGKHSVDSLQKTAV
jgi:hypothetical protein